ncbi:unnamed protein product [Diatraea saccharalis]|uniref:Leucine-rich repeat-containing protein 27 n=1 Tax=Diatraea saccharalis TaxID=40085 RepID=A0A9N9REX7_9NEOP|nr:unnamed protein product [Diatraea saccharalis]
MSVTSSTYEVPINIYEERVSDDTVCDVSSRNLESVPEINNKSLQVLYLKDNKIKCLPLDFFPSLPCLTYLDLRDNELRDIPTTVLNHQHLTHLLLQNNRLSNLPNELGTVKLQVLQLSGNPLVYPSNDILRGGVKTIIDFLHGKYVDFMLTQSQSDVSDAASINSHYPDLSQGVVSYNSVIHGDKLRKPHKALSIQFSEKDVDDSDEEYYAKIKGKCPKLNKSRHQVPTYYQSSKYVPARSAYSEASFNSKVRQNYLKEIAIKKHKEFVATRDKILQSRKNLELLKNWRKTYCYKKQFVDSGYKMQSKHFPYDTAPEYMTLLTRDDIEKDLPDKYRKNLVRRAKPSVPRKNNNDVHLAMKIKKLFENLEAIDLNKTGLTPRTEQRMLLGEIQKISEIKQKLSELTLTNGRSVILE